MLIVFQIAAFVCLVFITTSILKTLRACSRTMSEMALSVTESLTEMQERLNFSEMMSQGDQFEEIYSIVDDILHSEEHEEFDEDEDETQRKWNLPEDWQRDGDN